MKAGPVESDQTRQYKTADIKLNTTLEPKIATDTKIVPRRVHTKLEWHSDGQKAKVFVRAEGIQLNIAVDLSWEKVKHLINRPGVAGAVLQTSP